VSGFIREGDGGSVHESLAPEADAHDSIIERLRLLQCWLPVRPRMTEWSLKSGCPMWTLQLARKAERVRRSPFSLALL
jgi:hypothetical protein